MHSSDATAALLSLSCFDSCRPFSSKSRIQARRSPVSAELNVCCRWGQRRLARLPRKSNPVQNLAQQFQILLGREDRRRRPHFGRSSNAEKFFNRSSAQTRTNYEGASVELPFSSGAINTKRRRNNMENIEQSIEIDAPVTTVYNQWTQFEEFPRFMEGVHEVRQLDDKRLHWRAEIGGKEKEWDAEIYRQVPDQVIAWRSTSGARNEGEVRFDKTIDGKTRVTLAMRYEPETAAEKAGDWVGIVSARIRGNLNRFKDFVESRGRETGAWRGEIHAGTVSR
jgi:uncharacterized membrane protein